MVTYDVSTVTTDGENRLRKVAKVCEGFGQRVQKSVFECVLNEADLEVMRVKLRREMDLGADSLRIYRLREPIRRYLEVLGVDRQFDIREPLVL